MSFNFEFSLFSSQFQTDPQACVDHHISHSLDLATTLKTELAASNYKRDRLLNELTELKSTLCARDTECETLRVQMARQSALISSLQSRLTAAEQRDRTNQAKAENTTQTLQREKKILDDRIKDLVARARRLEADVATEESQREQIRYLLKHFLRENAPSFLAFPMLPYQKSIARCHSSFVPVLGHRCVRLEKSDTRTGDCQGGRNRCRASACSHQIDDDMRHTAQLRIGTNGNANNSLRREATFAAANRIVAGARPRHGSQVPSSRT